MKAVVVCTGNVARSPALAKLLQEKYPQHTFVSAAVGLKATSGRRMARNMRLIMEKCGWADYAEEHRSQLYGETIEDGNPDVVIACARVHMKYLAAIAPDVPHVLAYPEIFDPAFRGPEGYDKCWDLIEAAALNLGPMFE